MVALRQSDQTLEEDARSDLERKTREILSAVFPGSRAEIGWTPSGTLLCGFFGWDGFRNAPEAAPRIYLDAALDAGLTPEERRHVDFIIPMPMDTLLDHLEPLD